MQHDASNDDTIHDLIASAEPCASADKRVETRQVESRLDLVTLIVCAVSAAGIGSLLDRLVSHTRTAAPQWGSVAAAPAPSWIAPTRIAPTHVATMAEGAAADTQACCHAPQSGQARIAYAMDMNPTLRCIEAIPLRSITKQPKEARL